MTPFEIEPLASHFSSERLMPLISIIMPAYNAGLYIERAIQSVLDQTVQHWELIIVDDASTDQTESVVRKFLSDSRIRYHRVERIGHPAGVRNTGLKMASGGLIAFLDADDRYFPDTLAKLSRPLLENPRWFAVYGFAFSMDEHENPLPQAITLLPFTKPATAEDMVPYASRMLPPDYSHRWEKIVTSKISNMLPALMLRRSAMDQIGFFNENLCGPEDYEFYVRMFLHDYEGVYCLSDYVYQYRIHSNSLTKAPEHCQRVLESCLSIMDWLFTKASIPPESHAYQSEAYVACYRYLARERLINHQPEIARQLAWKAFHDSHVKRSDFLKYCAPLLLRTLLPPGLDRWMVMLRAFIRNLWYRLFCAFRPTARFQTKGGLIKP